MLSPAVRAEYASAVSALLCPEYRLASFDRKGHCAVREPCACKTVSSIRACTWISVACLSRRRCTIQYPPLLRLLLPTVLRQLRLHPCAYCCTLAHLRVRVYSRTTATFATTRHTNPGRQDCAEVTRGHEDTIREGSRQAPRTHIRDKVA